MAGVYIPGMEMPTRCEDCFCYRHNAEYDYAYCNISSVNVLGHGNARLVGCPLIPVPDHGRLIDKDALLDNCHIHWSQTTSESCIPVDDVDDAPTIIPADKEVDDG